MILVFKFIGANFLRAWIAHMETRQIKEKMTAEVRKT